MVKKFEKIARICPSLSLTIFDMTEFCMELQQVIPQSQLSPDGFAISFRRIFRHYRPGAGRSPAGCRVIFVHRVGAGFILIRSQNQSRRRTSECHRLRIGRCPADTRPGIWHIVPAPSVHLSAGCRCGAVETTAGPRTAISQLPGTPPGPARRLADDPAPGRKSARHRQEPGRCLVCRRWEYVDVKAGATRGWSDYNYSRT